MNKTDIRREQLRKWFEKGLPPKDKSYFSQVINGKASFGEKAVRRVEVEYNMPLGYLDDEGAKPSVARDGWPFISVKQELWHSLSEREKGTIEGYLKKMIEELLAEQRSTSETKESPMKRAA